MSVSDFLSGEITKKHLAGASPSGPNEEPDADDCGDTKCARKTKVPCEENTRNCVEGTNTKRICLGGRWMSQPTIKLTRKPVCP